MLDFLRRASFPGPMENINALCFHSVKVFHLLEGDNWNGILNLSLASHISGFCDESSACWNAFNALMPGFGLQLTQCPSRHSEKTWGISLRSFDVKNVALICRQNGGNEKSPAFPPLIEDEHSCRRWWSHSNAQNSEWHPHWVTVQCFSVFVHTFLYSVSNN